MAGEGNSKDSARSCLNTRTRVVDICADQMPFLPSSYYVGVCENFSVPEGGRQIVSQHTAQQTLCSPLYAGFEMRVEWILRSTSLIDCVQIYMARALLSELLRNAYSSLQSSSQCYGAEPPVAVRKAYIRLRRRQIDTQQVR